MINRNFKDFKFQHKRNQNQVLFISKKVKKGDVEVLNLINNFLIEKNSFIFESVEKRRIRGRYTIIGADPDKIWEFNKKKIHIIENNKKKLIKDQTFKINIQKNIPHGSGLGGGSANAASLLNFFNSKMRLKLSKDEINKIACQIGFDTPVSLEKKKHPINR